ncbi:MAG: nucleoside triphosphate pyrophosphohydrolase [Bryobacteraceae bacterium]|nr:nucleoside triphosphate pyrophosphohydrolase [Bryobacteraceae bacterium]
MARLRAPDGCPWDREQTLDSIQPYTLEETYEVFDAIDRRDMSDLREELGDYLLQAVFYAQIANEAGHFSIADSLAAINEKLIRRHPHVFGDTTARTAEDVKLRWDEIKRREKPNRAGLLDNVSRAQPALAEAQQLTHKAAKVGFDWPDAAPVIDKLREEIAELEAAANPEERADELGDILFAAVNLARILDIDAEQALRRSNRKFRARFAYIERNLAKPFAEATLEEMDHLWNEAKKTSPSAS